MKNDTGLPRSPYYTEWVSVHHYPEGIFIPLCCHYGKQLRAMTSRGWHLYPLPFLSTVVLAVIQEQSKVSLFHRSKLTGLKVIHITLRIPFFPFLLPQKTSSFNIVLTDVVYLALLQEKLLCFGLGTPSLPMTHPKVGNLW